MERRVFDERDEAVKRLIKQTIEVCNEMGKYVGICGQAPSDYPEFAGTTSCLHQSSLCFSPTNDRCAWRTDFLVECGIQSMSLNPDRYGTPASAGVELWSSSCVRLTCIR